MSQLPRINDSRGSQSRKRLEDDVTRLAIGTKLKQLELQQQQLQDRFQRRFNSFSEQQPLRINNALKIMQNREGQAVKSLLYKQNIIQETLNALKQNFKANAEISTVTFLQLQRRLQSLQFNYGSLQVSVQAMPKRQQQLQAPLGGGVQVRWDDKQMRQSILQQKIQRQQMHSQLARKLQQIENKIHLQDYDFSGKLKRNREELADDLKDFTRQARDIDRTRHGRSEHENEQLLQKIGGVQQRMQSQWSKRNKAQFQSKRQFQQKLSSLREQLKQEIRQEKSKRQSRDLQKELARFHQQQSSFKKSISQLVKKIHEESEEALKSVLRGSEEAQSRTNQQLKKLREELIVLQAMNNNTRELIYSQDNQKPKEVDHQHLRDEISKLNQILADEIKTSQTALQRENDQWHREIEQKNVLVLKQITSNLKSLKLQQQRLRKEKKEQNQKLRASLQSMKLEFEQSLKSTVNSIIGVFNNEFQSITKEVEMVLDVIALGKKQGEQFVLERIAQLHKLVNEQFMSEIKSHEKITLQKALVQARSEDKLLKIQLQSKLDTVQKKMALQLTHIRKDIQMHYDRFKNLELDHSERIERLEKAFPKGQSEIRKEVLLSQEKSQQSIRKLRAHITDQIVRERQNQLAIVQQNFQNFRRAMDLQHVKLKAESQRGLDSLKRLVDQIELTLTMSSKTQISDAINQQRSSRSQQINELRTYTDSVQRTTVEMIKQKSSSTRMLLQKSVHDQCGRLSGQIEQSLELIKADSKLLQKQLLEKFEVQAQTLMTLLANQTKKLDHKLVEDQKSVRRAFEEVNEALRSNHDEHQRILETVLEVNNQLQASIATRQAINKIQDENVNAAINMLQDQLQQLLKGGK